MLEKSTLPEGTAGGSQPVPDNNEPSIQTVNLPTRNGLLEALIHLARHHGRDADAADILSGLPQHEDGLTVQQLYEASSRIGLKIHIEQREATEIPAVTLPAVIINEGEPAVVLHAFDAKRKTAQIAIPGHSPDIRPVKYQSLVGKRAAIVVFATPVASSEASRADEAPTGRGHWFWSAVWRLWPNYLQVVIAAFLGNLLGLASPLFIMNVYDRVIPNLAIPTLWVLAGGVVLALLFDFVLKMLRMQVIDETGRRVDMAVAGRIFDHVLMMRLAARPGSTGATANRIRDLDTVRDALTSSSVVAVTDVLFIGVFLWVMWLLVGPLVLVPALAVPLLIGVTLFLQVPLSRALEESQNDSARRQSLLVEILSSLETVKVIGGEGWSRRAWDRSVAAASRSTTKARYWANLAGAFTGAVFQGVSVIIVVWGVFLVLDGSITVGALIAANILSGRVLSPLNNIAQTLSRVLHARTSLKALHAVMSTDSESNPGARTLERGRNEIAFDKLNFSYPGSQSPALDGISMRVEPGERIGLVGRVGSGKSTLVRILAGLYQPDTGVYLLNGIDTRQFSSAAIRAEIGLCVQEPELFSGSLRENILIGRPFASPEELERAVELSGVDSFSARHPEGLDMPIEERGRSLSGGQRQAVALARCLIRRPSVLCLDEPTAHMDMATERQLTGRLKAIADTGVTLVVASHRDGPLELVDRLLVLEKGKLAMDGPKQDVIARLKSGAQERAGTGKPPGGEL